MAKRLFIAIPLSESFKKTARNFQQNHKDLKVRWLADHNIHITIIPPFYQEDELQIIQIIEEIAKQQKPFKLKFTEITLGPNQKNSRLIWAKGEYVARHN